LRLNFNLHHEMITIDSTIGARMHSSQQTPFVESVSIEVCPMSKLPLFHKCGTQRNVHPLTILERIIFRLKRSLQDGPVEETVRKHPFHISHRMMVHL